MANAYTHTTTSPMSAGSAWERPARAARPLANCPMKTPEYDAAEPRASQKALRSGRPCAMRMKYSRRIISQLELRATKRALPQKSAAGAPRASSVVESTSTGSVMSESAWKSTRTAKRMMSRASAMESR